VNLNEFFETVLKELEVAVEYENEENEDNGTSWEAVNENPRVFCSVGPTPADALYKMGYQLASEGIEYWTASSVHFDDEGTCYLTIYV
jgi:hypothetical protein